MQDIGYSCRILGISCVQSDEGVCQILSIRNRGRKPIAQTNTRSPITESYRNVRTNIQFASVADTTKVILITSTVPSEGKTSTSSNLAIVSAQAGKRVLLIDADMRKPQIHQAFQISNLAGLTSLLIKEHTFAEAVIESETPGLFILPSGPIPPNPSEILSSQLFSDFIEQCQTEFDLVIIDTPPVLTVTDALVANRVADGVLFVIDSQRTNRVHVKKAVHALQQIDARILGVVLNRMKRSKGDLYYYQYYASNAN